MKKQGFTLIELLAVIVILAVIALIATPIILNVIEDSKKGAAEQSVIGYINGIENSVLVSELDNNSLDDGSYNINELNVEVKGNKPSSGNVTLENGLVVDAAICMNGYRINYTNSKAEVQGKCDEALVYNEGILNGTDPVLGDNMIPVTIEKDGTVKYADINKKWYSYRNKEWANAVILNTSNTYNVGDIIPESEIESYFVWIPRYKYKLFNVDNTSKDSKTYTIYTDVPSKAEEIEIIFENKETKESIGTKNGEYLTHPAFTSFESNGMWVGKFETGYKGATSTTSAQVNSNDLSKVIVKPNVYSWRNITINNIFLTSYNYKRNLDSHMMKNTEWGAVAYLSHSKYGINDDIRINNNSAYITGYAKTEQPTCGWTGTNEDCNKYESTSLNQDGTYTKRYNTEIGYLASTTGNITGIYDMSGGTHEYMAAYMAGKLGSSGITPTDYASKYFNVYNASSTATSYQYRILGDATGEMGPYTVLKSSGSNGNQTSYVSSWYTSYAYFVDSSYPWFYHGGRCSHGVLAGQFNFSRYTGDTDGGVGFRLVLTPQ